MEFLEDIPDLDFILTPVSGGGLLSGTAIAAEHMRPAPHGRRRTTERR